MAEKEVVNEAVVPSAITESEIVEANEEKRVDWKGLLKYLQVQKDAFRQYRIIAIGYTREKDWVMIDGVAYLQESGAQAIAGPMGVSIGKPTFTKEWAEDGKGKYYIYTCDAEVNSRVFNRTLGAVGVCTSRDRFFAVVKGELKELEEIDERNIKMKAFTNMQNNGIKRVLGMRNVEISELIKAGLDVNKISAVDHKSGGKKTEASKKAVEQAKEDSKQTETDPSPDQIEITQKLTEEIFKASTIDELKAAWEEGAAKRRALPKKLFDQLVVEKDKKKDWLIKQSAETKNGF